MATDPTVGTDLAVETEAAVGTVPIALAPTVPTAAAPGADARYGLTNLAMTRPASVIPTVRSTMAISV